MTKKGEINRLRMQNRMKFYISRPHLVVVYSQVRIEFTCHALEWAILRGEHPAVLPTGLNDDTSQIGKRRIDNIAQSPPRASHNEGRASQIRRRNRQIHDLHFWKKRCDVQRLAKTNGEIPGRAF